MNIYEIILWPLLCGAIGWGTNWLAVKMLFRPLKPINIGPWKIHGLLPRRQEEFAGRLAGLMTDHLLTEKDRQKILKNIPIKKHLRKLVDYLIDQELAQSSGSGGGLMGGMKTMMIKSFQTEIHKRLPDDLDTIDPGIIDELLEEIDLVTHVEERIMEFDPRQLESLMTNISHREITAIQWAGAGLGFLIGLIQVGVIMWLRSRQLA